MMRSTLQETLLISLAAFLRPIAKLVLQAGLGSSEFIAVAKSVFVQVATEEFGLRGRPTNISRVSAMTGLSRKEVSRIKSEGPVNQRWTPDLESNPANTVVHYWHYDPDFSTAPGNPKPLPLEGDSSFTTLVARYAGDIPPGAVRAELRRAGTIDESGGLMTVRRRYYVSAQFDEDLIHRLTFALKNLSETVVHNAQLYQRSSGLPEELGSKLGRLERCAWTERLRHDDAMTFRSWVRDEGVRFIEHVDGWLGKHELPRNQWKTHSPRTMGIGIYYFEEDEDE